MRYVFRFVTQYPRSIIAFISILTLFFAFQIPKLKISVNMKDWVPDDHPVSLYNDQMEEQFGVVDPVIVGVMNDGPEGIFNSHTLGLIYDLTQDIEDLDGVVVGDTIGLASTKNITGTDEGLEVEPFMESVPETSEGITALREAVYENDMFIGNIVSRDGRAALIIVKYEEGQNKKKIYRDIAKLIGRYREEIASEDTESSVNSYLDIDGEAILLARKTFENVPRIEGGRQTANQEEIFFTGKPVMEGLVAIDISRDLRRMLPIVAAVVVVVLYFTFKCVRGILLPLAVVGTSTAWALGIMAITGVPLYAIATWIPIILIAIGCAYGIHILNRYFEETSTDNSKRTPREVVIATMEDIWKPVAMASFTTFAGFLSLVTVVVKPIRAVGIFTSIGILCALIFSLTLIPAALSMMKVKAIGPVGFLKEDASRRKGLVDRILSWGGRFAHIRRVPLILFALLAILFSIWYLPNLYIDDGLALNLSQKNEVLKAHYFLNDLMGGSTVLSIVVDGKKTDAMKDPDLLRRLDRLQEFIDKQEGVGESVSLAEYIKRMHLVMNENKQEFQRIPDSRDLTAQYLLLYSISGDPDDFDEVVDYDYRKANVKVLLKRDTAVTIRAFLDKINPFLKELFGDLNVEAVPTGNGRIIVLMVDLIISGLMISLFVALIIVFVITASMFRSPFVGLITLVPITIATLLNFGILSAFGIRLGVATAMNSCIGIGIGIDYTIHFISRYRKMLNSGMEPRLAISRTMLSSGKAIFFNALVVTLGFLVLVFSVTPPNQSLGLLVSLNMVTSFLGAMTILPAILSFIPPGWIMKQESLAKNQHSNITNDSGSK